jgi:hypothetical protein
MSSTVIAQQIAEAIAEALKSNDPHRVALATKITRDLLLAKLEHQRRDAQQRRK